MALGRHWGAHGPPVPLLVIARDDQGDRLAAAIRRRLATREVDGAAATPAVLASEVEEAQRAPSVEPLPLFFRSCVVDARRGLVWPHGGVPRVLPPTATRVLCALAERRGRYVPASAVAEFVRSDRVSKQQIANVLTEIRSAIEPDPKDPVYLLTFGTSYQLEDLREAVALPFVGRAAEVELLRGLHQAKQPVLVTGIAGAGKSTLVCQALGSEVLRCDLDGIESLHGIVLSLARTCGVMLSSDRTNDPVVELAARLSIRPGALFLDHVEAGAGPLEELVHALVSAGIGALVVASRAPISWWSHAVVALGGLPSVAAHELVVAAHTQVFHRDLPTSEANRIVEVADGHPLALHTLLAAGPDAATMAVIDRVAVSRGSEKPLVELFSWHLRRIDSAERALARLRACSRRRPKGCRPPR